MGLLAGPRAPCKKWDVLCHQGALASEMLTATKLGYLCRDPCQAHPQDEGVGEAGSTQVLIRERRLLVDAAVGV